VKSVLQFLTIAIIILITSNNLYAQLCTGSLGDPIVNITFGAGQNPGQPIKAAATGYQYVSTDCPNDGFYTIRNNTSDCFSGTWQSFSDHTGNANGYFMLVNASIAPSAFYVDTVHNLCGTTTYEFAAWILNILKPSACHGNGILPNLTFSIEKTDGTVLQTYNSGDIPNQYYPIWQQFGFSFLTPTGISDVVIRIINNAKGGCGNDLALDDITFRVCGPKLTPSIEGSTNTSDSICAGTAKSYIFKSTITAGFQNPYLQWQIENADGTWADIAGANFTMLSVDFPATALPGTYTYRIAAVDQNNKGSLQCRILSTTLIIRINTNPNTTSTSNGPACQNGSLILTATGGTQYLWTGVNNYTANTSPVTITNIQLTQAGKYYVMVANINGCKTNDSTNVVVNPTPVATTSFASATICSGNNIQLQSGGGGTYVWTPVAGLSNVFIANPFASPVITTSYMVTISNQFSCSDTASLLITVNEIPTANAGPDRTIIAGNSIKLLATASGQSTTYLWTPSSNIDDAHILQPTVTPPYDTNYILNVQSTNGCGTATSTMHVFVFKAVYIPSAFTPNGDGDNDTWKIPALNAYPLFELSVFNRYGQIVFHNSNINIPWDGTYKGQPTSVGSYIYMIDLKQPPGILKGSILLLR